MKEQKGKPEAKSHGEDRRGDSEEYECLRCDTKQVESSAIRIKGYQVRCRGCGAPAHPMKSVLVRQRVFKVCKDCGCRLRTGNSSSSCSLCRR